MMKATEIQIGDWIKIGDADNYHGYFGKVRAINSITGYCIIGAKIGKDIYTQTDVFIDDIEPIPLTPEILEKNGWKRDLDKEWKYNNSHILSRYCYQWENRNVKIEMDAGIDGFTTSLITGRRFYTVHELQHALCLCGLDELADNFQV